MTDEELVKLLRRMSPRLDMLDCEYVLTAADRIKELEAKLAKVKASFRINMMHALPAYTHEQFDKDYEEMMGGKDE